MHLEELMHPLLPLRLSSHVSLVLVNSIPIVLSATSIDINLFELQPSFSLPEVTTGPEEENNRESEISLEEIGGASEFGLARRSNGDIELCSEGDDDEENSEP